MALVNKYAAAALAAAGKQEQTNEFWCNVVILTESSEFPYASVGGFPLTGEIKSKGANSSNAEFAAMAAAGIGAQLELYELAKSLEPGEAVYLLPKDSTINVQIVRAKAKVEADAVPRPKFNVFK